MNEFETRRNKLFALMEENSVALIFAGASKILSEDECYPFESNRNFFYLTNIKQENSVLMLVKSIGSTSTYLFVDEYNELKEKWTGRRITFEEAKKESGINNIYSTDNLETMFSLAISFENNNYGEIRKVYLDLAPELKIKERYSTIDFKNDLEKKYSYLTILDAYPLIRQLRMFKSEFEIEQIKDAISLTRSGINDLIVYMKPGLYEYELSDRFEFFGRSHGRHGLAFSTISASGVNATCLHYPIRLQEEKIKDGDLILFDLGYETNGYSADISRTLPVNGTFTPLQKKIYTAVLNCNKAAIEYVHEGITLLDLQNFAIDFLSKECIRLGLMNEGDDIRKYYYHSISHHLGLDTHDVSDRSLPLKAGNVITIEPGLYFKEHGIGVRIEDDVLVTNSHAIVLSRDIKKEIEDIEKLFKSKGSL